jgi:hypothetical protein
LLVGGEEQSYHIYYCCYPFIIVVRLKHFSWTAKVGLISYAVPEIAAYEIDARKK